MKQSNFHPHSFIYLGVILFIIIALLASCYPVQQGSKGCALANRAGDGARITKMKH